MILTLKELAEHLKLNDRTVMRMLKTGQIQGVKVGGQWRFNGSQIDRVFFPAEIGSEDVPLSELTHTQFGIPVSRLTNENRIFLDMKATNVEEAIAELTNPQLFNSLVLDIQDLRAKCMARESLLSTGVGNGIAVPHPRDPIPTLRASGCIVIGRSKAGIDYNAADGKPVHLFFLICSQTIELHLHLIGKIATLIHHQKFIDLCKTTESPSEIIRAIMEYERAEFLKPEEETESGTDADK